MIVSTSELPALASTVAMVDGGFDPLHPGHIAYFHEAASLGLPVLCNVSSDDWVRRKHVPVLTQEERGELIDAIRWIDYVHLASTTTNEVLRSLRPRMYVKGADWRDRIPAEERETCAELGIEVVYLDTVTSSSSRIIERYQERLAGRSS
jgi:cytidyltransferase-like protein